MNATPLPPTGLQADAVDSGGLKTRLTWTASGSVGVTGYRIYSRAIDEPYLAQIGTSTSTTFDTGDPWAENSSIKTHLYAVSAVKGDGTESFLSNMAQNDDRDHDDLTDEQETSLGTNVSNPDSDGDGLTDGEEYIRGTNPLLADTDGDGYSDYLEVQNGTDPLDPNSPPTYSISGTVTGDVQAGVTMTLSGSVSATTVTNASGNYIFRGLSNGTYTVTPSKLGYGFSPKSTTVTISGANVTGINFTPTCPYYSICGTVTCDGQAGVTMTLSGTGSGSTTTDASGYYCFTGLCNGTYVVTPSKSGCTFTPASRQATISGASVTGVDFTCTCTTTFSISGTVTGDSQAGITMTLTGSVSKTTTTDSSGNYTFSGLSNSTYTVTPSKAGYTFTPPSREVTIAGANETEANFTATQVVSNGTIGLPKTGQTKCYDSAGTEINCSGTGQDGDIQAGIAWPDPRFTDNYDGTMTDNLTGLMWTKDANLPGVAKTWQEALDYVAGMNAGMYPNFGHTDWCLPNVNELESQVNCGEPDMATWLNSQGFVNLPSCLTDDFNYSYWSSTTSTYDVNMALAVTMYSGSFYLFSRSDSNCYVWPVRGGQDDTYPSLIWKTGQTTSYRAGDDGDLKRGVAWPSQRFTGPDGTIPITDNVVLDQLTGLMWTKDANLLVDYGTLQEILDYVAGMNAGIFPNYGYTDWRLPNRKELYSLIDFSRSNPALPSEYPFANVVLNYYPTSTSRFGCDLWATVWSIDIRYGIIFGFGKDSYFTFWPVRGGEIGPVLIKYSISGTVTDAVQAGVTMTLSGSVSKTTTTDSSGNYIFSGLSNGTYTVTPSKTGYTFTPTNRQVQISEANVIGVDFTATSVSCTYSISSTSQSFSTSGGTGSVSVITQSGCTWTATSNDSWITITSGNSGSGNGTVNYSVSTNTGSQRTGTITIAGQTFTVTQEGITECSAWSDVISKYNAYVDGQASWDDVITCYTQYASSE